MGLLMLLARRSAASTDAQPAVIAIRSLTVLTSLVLAGLATALLALLMAVPQTYVGCGTVGTCFATALVRLHRNYSTALTGIVAAADKGAP